MGGFMNYEYKKEFVLNFLYVASVLAIIIFASKYLFAYLFPFVIGVSIALIVQKPANTLALRFRFKKPVCAVVLTVLICAAVFALAGLAAWSLGGRLAAFIGKMPDYFTAVQDSLERIKNDVFGDVRSLDGIFSGAVSSFLSRITAFASNLAAGFVKGLPAFLISSIVTVVASCYIAKDFDRLKKFVIGVVPDQTAKKIGRVKNIIVCNTVKFVKGYGIIAIITFIQLSALFAILGIEKPVLRALLVSLVDALPVLGVGTVLIPWAAIELLQRNFYVGFGILIGYAAVMIIRNFLEPKIIGDQIGINPIFTLLSMFLGLKISGVSGLILFPLALTVVVEYYRDDMPEKSYIAPA